MINNVLRVKEFGPVKDVTVRFNRFTVFVGPQGSGKSTLAKLYSMFLWLEKRLIRGMESVKQVEKASRFRDIYCAYYRLTSYFKGTATVIEFTGHAYMFSYKSEIFTVTERKDDGESHVVKVMYIPSERNFLSSLRNLTGLKTLPDSLSTFKDEYEAALIAFSKGYKLPIDGVQFEYDRLNRVSWLMGEDYKVRLSDASSGFQAVLPMLLVSEYLTDAVSKRYEGNDNVLSIEERDKLRDEVNRVMNNPSLSSEVREAALSSLSSRFRYSGFVNVVEEPEENLYPESQKNVLYALLRLVNRGIGNQLVLTTHSPYMINYLTLAIKASELMEIGVAKENIDKVVPVESCILEGEVSIYELAKGHTRLLTMPGGIPSDDNFLNRALADTNESFGRLLDLEDDL